MGAKAEQVALAGADRVRRPAGTSSAGSGQSRPRGRGAARPPRPPQTLCCRASKPDLGQEAAAPSARVQAAHGSNLPLRAADCPRVHRPEPRPRSDARRRGWGPPEPEETRGFEPAVPGNEAALLINQDRGDEAELPNRVGDLTDLLLRVRPGVSVRGDELGGPEPLNLSRPRAGVGLATRSTVRQGWAPRIRSSLNQHVGEKVEKCFAKRKMAKWWQSISRARPRSAARPAKTRKRQHSREGLPLDIRHALEDIPLDASSDSAASFCSELPDHGEVEHFQTWHELGVKRPISTLSSGQGRPGRREALPFLSRSAPLADEPV